MYPTSHYIDPAWQADVRNKRAILLNLQGTKGVSTVYKIPRSKDINGQPFKDDVSRTEYVGQLTPYQQRRLKNFIKRKWKIALQFGYTSNLGCYFIFSNLTYPICTPMKDSSFQQVFRHILIYADVFNINISIYNFLRNCNTFLKIIEFPTCVGISIFPRAWDLRNQPL